METASQADAPRARLAGFWRRLGAFAIDWLILAAVGNVLGQLLFDPLAWIGGWGRVVGFVVSTAYFGLLDSGAFGAGTPGKRALGLRVVDSSGRTVPWSRTLVRGAVLTAPLMFNGMILVMSEASYGLRAISGLMGGLALMSLYFVAFNRRTGQGLHDLAVGAFVVHGRASRRAMDGLTLWRPHLAIAGLFVVFSVPLAVAGLPVWMTFTPTTSSVVSRPPSLGAAELRAVWVVWTPPSGAPRTCESVSALLRGTGVDDESLARRLGRNLVARAHCHIDTNLRVRLFYGYDLGFAAGRRYRDFVIDEDLLVGQP